MEHQRRAGDSGSGGLVWRRGSTGQDMMIVETREATGLGVWKVQPARFDLKGQSLLHPEEAR